MKRRFQRFQAGLDIVWQLTASRMNEILEALEERTPLPGKGTELSATGQGFAYNGKPDTREAAQILQLTIRRASETKLKVYYGRASGLGFNGLIEGLTDGEWTELDGSANAAVYLRVTFEPTSEPVTVYDGTGEQATIYGVGPGGDKATVSVVIIEGDEPPVDTKPEVNTDSGEPEEDGVYYLRVGRLLNGKPLNDVYGPLIFSFCPPNSIKYFESVNRS